MFLSRYSNSMMFALSSVVFVGVTSLAAAPDNKPAATKAAHPKPKMASTETALYLEDMHCKTCAKKVARKLFAVKGVVKVRTDVKADLAIVTPQQKKKLDPLALWKAVKAAGFPAVKLIGPGGTYVPDPEKKGAAKLVPERTATAHSASQ